MFKKMSQFIVASSFLLAVAPSYAEFYSFDQITNNGDTNVEAQLKVEVTAAGGGVLFKFTNNVGTGSSITDIYFDNDPALLSGLATITVSDAGVAFSQPATPGDLPGLNGFTTAGFSADSNPPAAPNGVDSASEWVALQFALAGTSTFNDVLAGLNAGTFRIGLHVQSIDQLTGGEGESNSFVTVVPEPEIYAMMAAGLGLMGFVARRRKQQAAA